MEGMMNVEQYVRAIKTELGLLGVSEAKQPSLVAIIALAMALEEQGVEIGDVGITCAVIGYLSAKNIKRGKAK